MGFAEAVRACFRNYTGFSGRASRPEFWWFFLFVMLGQVFFAIVDGLVLGAGALFGFEQLFGLATFLPLLAVSWRRLHDIDLPGWLNLCHLPFLVLFLVFTTETAKLAAVGVMMAVGIWLLILLIRPSDRGPNRFGSAP